MLSEIQKSSQNDESIDTLKVELAKIQSELDKNNHFLKGLYESLILSDINDGEYKDLKSAYELKIVSLKEQEKRLKSDIQSHNVQKVSAKKAEDKVQTINDISDLTTETVARLIEKISVYEDGSIAVKFNFAEDIEFSEESADNE